MLPPTEIDMLLSGSEFNASAFQKADFFSTSDRPIAQLASVQCGAVICDPPDNLSTRKVEKAFKPGKLRFTRHARNRMRLYGIMTEDEEVYRNSLSGPETEGTRTVLFGEATGEVRR